jgi:hypothetical protein
MKSRVQPETEVEGEEKWTQGGVGSPKGGGAV